MQPQFQTSFIPKKPIITGASPGLSSSPKINVVRETNVLSIVASILFISSLLAYGGLYGYKYWLQKNISKTDTSINEARATFQPEKIKELIDADAKIKSSKSLIEKHVVTSRLLYFLQDITVKKMRIVSFSYSNKDGQGSIRLDGLFQTYNALADQSDTFQSNESLTNQVFSNFLLKENGYIQINFTATIDRSVVSYKKSMISGSDSTETVPATVPDNEVPSPTQ